MATVTAFTAARSQAIEDQAITGAHLDGDDLVLEPNNAAEINIGNVRGPVGPQGPAAPEQPTGMITMFAGDSAPSGYLLCLGQAIDRTTYADLFALIGTTYGVGDGSTTFNVPDLQDKFPLGAGNAIPGDEGGFADATLPSHSHTGPSHTHNGPSHTHSGPNHSHSIDHNHGSVNSSTAGSHQHSYSTFQNFWAVGLDGPSTQVPSSTVVSGTTLSAGDHQHSVNLPNYTGTSGNSGTGNTGASGTGATSAAGTGATSTSGESAVGKNIPPYLCLAFIIKT